MGRPLCAFAAASVLVSAAAAGRQPSDAPAAPVFTGFVVKVTSVPESTEAARGVVARAAEKPQARGWAVRDVPGLPGVFRLVAPATEAQEAEEMTPAEAWSRAHALRGDPQFEYVEPSFALPGAPGEVTELEDCAPALVPESGGSGAPIPGAAQDAEWSLGPRGANVFEAWKLFAERTPGQGVWIGHPDTGYRQHPEIWSPPDSAIRPDLGWDFVENKADPADGFSEGILRWPGHGTRTSSVIVSPRGRQLPGSAARGVSGVAPGARVIPLRVANGVVLFDPANLASAIRAAASDDRNLVKQQVQVISISLGGPPSRPLADAVAFAEARGVLVIAAAGNNVRKVVWPARYPHVIAIAASNYDGRTWSGSSGGSRVAVGAPGESVWVASPKLKEGSPVNCLAMSSGTSYGTATTAGIAALWVSFHRDTPGFTHLASSGQLTAAFRQILRSTARAGTLWDTSRYGAGIVDALAVLEAPLPRVLETTPATTPPSRCDRDLAALESLFERSAEPGPRARIARLFDKDVCAIASLADEVAFLYATDSDVARAIDAISTEAAPSRAAYRDARRALRHAGSQPLRRALPSR